MKKYYDNISKEIKDYFEILEPNFPEWLNEYIDTKELLSQQYISVTCGTIYSNLFESDFFFKFGSFCCSCFNCLAFYA